ncbi:hypothetical protein N7450_006165 [Penicillium hetheringtonii]|uniref:Poly [ADP-ribose] polymerase n=1 Tax=Penicillium hetheringtonii TaxID=911720 RepID=A0AAD6DK56_9EURO|nr:hypothetical protein N7450_006165 [Penicillium hetheringtonii]
MLISPNPIFSGLIIARLTTRYGGAFEELDISICTHLVASFRAVEKDYKKVREASEVEGLLIVSQEWFFESVEKEMLLDGKKYLLRIPFKAKTSVGTKLLPGKKLQEQNRSRIEPKNVKTVQPKVGKNVEPKDRKNVEPPETHEKILEKKHELHAMVDDDCPWKSKKYDPYLTFLVANTSLGNNDIVVWLDDNNVVWDAILIKDTTTTVTHPTYCTKAAPTPPRPLPSKLSREKKNLEDDGARATFEKYFYEKTGLFWEGRWNVPQKNKYIFVPRIFEDVEVEDAANSAVNKDHACVELPQEVYDVLSTIFGHPQKAHAEAVINKVSGGRLYGKQWHFRIALRVARSLIQKIKEIVFGKPQRRDKSSQVLLKTLGETYLALMWNANLHDPPGWKLPASSEVKTWVNQEIAALELLSNLSYATDMIESSISVTRNQILNKVYLGLGLADMTPVQANSEEYKALVNYFTKAVSSSHVLSLVPINIFRIEREGEKDRFMQYQETHSKFVGDRRLLFHGSEAANFIGILSQGLRTNAQTRYTPGGRVRGIYFADLSTVSAAYSMRTMHSSASYCMLLCEVEVGKKVKTYVQAPDGVIDQMHREGHISALAVGQTDYNKWCDAKSIHPDLAGIQIPDVSAKRSTSTRTIASEDIYGDFYCALNRLPHNEWVVYDPAQVRQRYFIHFKANRAGFY